VVTNEDLRDWLRLLIRTVEGRNSSADPLPAALLFLLLSGAQLVEVDEGVTVIAGRMNLGGWRPEWREIGFDLLAVTRAALRRLEALPES
jgi:hypothetical protein